MRTMRPILAAVALALLMSGCAAGKTTSSAVRGVALETVLPDIKAVKLGPGERLRAVATTGIVADVVAHVGGDALELQALMGPGQDPHSYSPTPQDIAAVENAQVVFINGFRLEEGLAATVETVAARGQPVVSVSAGIKPRVAEDTSEHPAGDPHVWTDPSLVNIWVQNIAATLSALDPARASSYRANAAAYARQLDELDGYIRGQVAKVPADRRKLVTDHDQLSYLAARYRFEVVGAVIPGITTAAEPSAKDLAALTDKIRAQHVTAVFVGTDVNPKMAELVAKETGARLVPLYSGSLGPAGSGADTYLGMMRANIDRIVQGLGGGT